MLNEEFTKNAGAAREAVQWGAMTEPSKSGAQAGGFLIAAGILAGVLGGIMLGEPSAGFLIGLAVGGALALLIWRRDKRR